MAVGSRAFKAEHLKARVSDSRFMACLHLSVPFKGSKLQGLGPFFQVESLENNRASSAPQRCVHRGDRRINTCPQMLFKRYDTSHNGRLEFEEFYELFLARGLHGKGKRQGNNLKGYYKHHCLTLAPTVYMCM